MYLFVVCSIALSIIVLRQLHQNDQIYLADFMTWAHIVTMHKRVVTSELNDPICHSNECQIGSFSSEATV